MPLRRSRGSAVPSDGARTCRAGKPQPDYKRPSRSQPPEPERLCLALQPALSAFISSPCVYQGGFLLRAVAVPRNADAERVAAALRSPWQAISSGPGPRPRWLCRDSVTPLLQPCPGPSPAPCLPWHPPSSKTARPARGAGETRAGSAAQMSPHCSPAGASGEPVLLERGLWARGVGPQAAVSSWLRQLPPGHGSCGSIPRAQCPVCSSGVSGKRSLGRGISVPSLSGKSRLGG